MVSIHAPAKGTTGDDRGPKETDTVSIHAPAKGTTNATVTVSGTFASFNPRSREGNDYAETDYLCSGNVSIHAPAKGTTYNDSYMAIGNYVSIHAPAKGTT